jgi:hypothetical protein
MDGAEQVAVVRYRDRRHFHPLGRVDKAVDPAGAVEQAVMRVVVQVDEFVHDRVVFSGSRRMSAPTEPSFTSMRSYPRSRW